MPAPRPTVAWHTLILPWWLAYIRASSCEGVLHRDRLMMRMRGRCELANVVRSRVGGCLLTPLEIGWSTVDNWAPLPHEQFSVGLSVGSRASPRDLGSAIHKGHV